MKLKRRDAILLTLMLLAGLLLGGFLLLTKTRGAMVQVMVDGQLAQEYPLNRDLTTVISGHEGGTNTLVIENGYAWVKNASCPDHVCEGMGKIRYDGQAVICLPNRVVVQISGGKKSGNADIFGF